jgi:putative component of membrane protein insertase Oxa1/YidC/SpoIIIJ protein YidD
MFKKFFLSIFTFLIDSFRPLFGPPGCCIYPITCRDYAKIALQEKSIFIAIPLIIFRLLSCNPITGIFLRLRKNLRSKNG